MKAGDIMRVAIVGSRTLTVNHLENYLPEDTVEIISGGAAGVDTCACRYALANNIPLTEFLPEYKKYGRSAPILRNMSIIQHADLVLIFWDGKSAGSRHVIRQCRRLGREYRVFLPDDRAFV